MSALTNILTLRLNAEAQAHFERMRQRYFPAERNHIPAHLTLFHTLPDNLALRPLLNEVSQAQRAFAIDVTGIRSLGNGVAFTLASATLIELHARLAGAFSENLTAQDRQRFQPHIVVQNKVSSDTAQRLLGELRSGFQPGTIEGQGLDLWRYLSGPWRHLETFPFLPLEPSDNP